MKRVPGKNSNGLIAALDVGSSKVCCFIAETDGIKHPRVIGIGQQASHGVKAGSIIDMEAAESAIRSTVYAAEEMANETVHEVAVNLSGGYPASRQVRVEIPIAGQEVGELDLRRALEEGQQATCGRLDPAAAPQLIHSIPVGFTLDGNRGIRNPRGMIGELLGVDMHLVTARSSSVRNLSTCVERCHLDVGGFVVSPYASGLSVLVEDERELGVTLVDMGGGTTTIAVFLEGQVIFTDSIPVGGSHVTSDIARGLSTTRQQAERLKTLYGHAMAAEVDDREVIEVLPVGEEESGATQQIARSYLTGIIQPRLEETFELVRSHLEASGLDKLAGRRVVLTGGACQLPGVRDLAALVLDKQVRLGRPLRIQGLAEATSGPAFATCSGLIAYAIAANLPVAVEARAKRGEPDGLMGRLGHWFREHL